MTRPLPAPLPDRTAIQDAEDDADHLQSAAVVTESEKSPPFAVADWLEGDTSYLHVGAGGGVASCDIVTVVPLTSTFPDRADPSFALTV